MNKHMDEDVARERHKETLAQIARAKEIPTTLLRCRVGGDRHDWARIQPTEPGGRGITAKAKKCRRCGTTCEWTESTHYGYVIGRPMYRHPDGYRMPKDPAASGTNRLRPEAVRLLIAKADREIELPTADEVISEWEEESRE